MWTRIIVGFFAGVIVSEFSFLHLQEESSRQQRAMDSAVQSNQAEVIKEINQLLVAQAECWNKGDIEGFMGTYWNDPGLTFSSGGTTTYGWDGALARYRLGYPAGTMGELRFEIDRTELLSDSASMLLGRYFLRRQGIDFEGNFTLVLRKIGEDWGIIHDHSSARKMIEEKKQDD